MNDSPNRTIFTVIGIVVVIVIGLFLWKHFSQTLSTSSQAATTTAEMQTASSSVVTSQPVISPVGSGTVQVQAPQNTTATEPSLNRPIPNTSGLDPTLVASTEADMQATIADLATNKTSFQDWIELGIDRKTLGDYTGAIQAWNYAGILYPTNVVSFGNLGDLYANFLKDDSDAEINYLAQITNVPTDIDAYRELFTIYISENKTTQAVALLQQGIAANQNTFDLQVLLARYYVTAGNIPSAKIYYNQAITVAQKQGNVSEENSLQTEEANIQ